ncbi:MAG: sodium-dependent transporter [Simkaniaceae bacterium]|nr:sodium-dependent transporter [Simkaniaceae bacterium]
MAREEWRSRIGFIWAAVGSAIGLGSIWRFPYVVGANGGAVFILLYLLCLIAVGFPVLIAEIVIGRKTALSPSGAFEKLGGNGVWKTAGKTTIITGFLVSTFYSVISGWTLAYLIDAVRGKLIYFGASAEALSHFKSIVDSPCLVVGVQGVFMLLAGWILYTGVRKGIERGNTIMMPLLLFVLVLLVVKGLSMPGAGQGIQFMFYPDWSLVTPGVVMMALGQAFFSLSLGQGTMVTYGSYLKRHENIPLTCFPIALFGVVISLLSGIAIFSIVFSMGMEPTSGVSLMFETLPLIFSTLPGGYLLSIAFFLLLLLAALTSQISALEPMIAYLIDRHLFKRHYAVVLTCLASFLLGIPSALSGEFLNGVMALCVDVLIPLGGLCAVILVGWRWGMTKALDHLEVKKGHLLGYYLKISLKYVAPCLIVAIMLHNTFCA